MHGGASSTEEFDDRDELLKQAPRLESSSASSSVLQDDISDKSAPLYESAQLRSEHAIHLLFSNFQKKAARVLLDSEMQPNRVTKVQYLREKFEKEKAENQEVPLAEEVDSSELILSQAVDKQIQQLSSYQILAQSFEQRQKDVQEYLQLIRVGLQDKPVTIENVAVVLKKWLEEFKLADKIASGQISSASIAQSSMSSESSGIPLPNKSGAFHAFLTHCLISKSILEKITHEVRYSKPSEQLTEEDVKTALLLWDQIDRERYARLESHFRSVIPKVEEWKSLIPQALTYEEMQERERTNPRPYHAEETKRDRRERRMHISGFEPCLQQLKQGSVVQNLAERSRKEKTPVIKQHCELLDHQRLEMQYELGIRPFSKNRQGYGTLAFSLITGHDVWQTEFVGAKLDSDLPPIFPDRKKQVAKQLLPLMERKLALNQKLLTSGVIVESSSSEANHVPSEAEQGLDAIVERLHRLKI